jgi:uncharacterized protein YijF (DUF1287 family)
VRPCNLFEVPLARSLPEGLEEQIKVLRDDDEEEQSDDENNERNLEDLKKWQALIKGNAEQLKSQALEWMQMERDIDKVKGQKNKAVEVASLADARAAQLQSEMIKSCALACLSQLVSDVEVAVATAATETAKEAEEQAIVLSNTLNSETIQLMHMLDVERSRCKRIENNIHHQSVERERLMQKLQQKTAALAQSDTALGEREGAIEALRLQLEQSEAVVTAGHAREEALRRAIHDLGSARVVDYIMSRTDLCPDHLLEDTGGDAFASQSQDSAIHVASGVALRMSKSLRTATAAYEATMAWRKERFGTGQFSEPRVDEVHQWSHVLGMDPGTDESLLWLAEESLWSPVAAPWVEMQRNVEGQLLEDRLYYKDTNTSAELLEHPLNAHYRKVATQLREINQAIDSACMQMRQGLVAMPPGETVREAWQQLVDSNVCEIFRQAVCRHRVIRGHYELVAGMLQAPGSSDMSNRLRVRRPGKRKKRGSNAARHQLHSDSHPLVMGGAKLAAPADLRVRCPRAEVGTMLLGGGSAAASADCVQWYRSNRGLLKAGSDSRLCQQDLNAVDFTAIPKAQTLSYTVTPDDIGRLLRLCVSTAGLDAMYCFACDAPVEVDSATESNAANLISAGAVDVPLTAARSGNSRRLFALRSESGSRVEVRDSDGSTLLTRPLHSVTFKLAYDFFNSILLTDATSGEVLMEAGEYRGLATASAEPIVLQATTAAIRDELLLALRQLA